MRMRSCTCVRARKRTWVCIMVTFSYKFLLEPAQFPSSVSVVDTRIGFGFWFGLWLGFCTHPDSAGCWRRLCDTSSHKTAGAWTRIWHGAAVRVRKTACMCCLRACMFVPCCACYVYVVTLCVRSVLHA